MFKDIPMHTKPVKHAKYIEKKRFFKKSILMSKVGPKIYALQKS